MLACKAQLGNCPLVPARQPVSRKDLPRSPRACDKLPPDTLIDGEVVANRSERESVVQRTPAQPQRTQLQFYAFDVLITICAASCDCTGETARNWRPRSVRSLMYPRDGAACGRSPPTHGANRVHRMDAGYLRHSTYTGLRDDKESRNVRREYNLPCRFQWRSFIAPAKR